MVMDTPLSMWAALNKFFPQGIYILRNTKNGGASLHPRTDAARVGSGVCMKGNPEERAVALGQYVVETGATVRFAAQQFGISKSTVHMDVPK